MTFDVLLHNARVVLPDRVLDDGWLRVADATIAAVGTGAPPAHERAIDLHGCWLLPGFVDLHMHGGGGHDVSTSPAAMVGAAAFHRGHGTTRTLVSLVTAPLDDLERQLGWIADVADGSGHAQSGVIGAHLEGPFLSHARCGAQNPQHLRRPDRREFARLLAAARGTLRSITVAPELHGALDVIADAVGAGVVAAIGHTDATYDETRRAIAGGASLATHLFNGMRPIHHREPGPAGAALASGLACEVINDGVHVHPAITTLVARGSGQLVLVTDAIDAAGAGDGEVELGGQPVVVRDGQARLATTGSLAGSTLTMDVALRRAVDESGLSMVEASTAASGHPARLIGGAGRFGVITPGYPADLVVLDDALRVRAVAAGGRWDQRLDTLGDGVPAVTDLVQTNLSTGLDHSVDVH